VDEAAAVAAFRDGFRAAHAASRGTYGAPRALASLTEMLTADVMTSQTLYGDDTPVRVLAPGCGRTKTGRIWTYIRDERPFGGARPPAALFLFAQSQGRASAGSP
jgi:hypothetical protein